MNALSDARNKYGITQGQNAALFYNADLVISLSSDAYPLFSAKNIMLRFSFPECISLRHLRDSVLPGSDPAKICFPPEFRLLVFIIAETVTIW